MKTRNGKAKEKTTGFGNGTVILYAKLSIPVLYT
jgi:hypothetical protein